VQGCFRIFLFQGSVLKSMIFVAIREEKKKKKKEEKAGLSEGKE